MKTKLVEKEIKERKNERLVNKENYLERTRYPKVRDVKRLTD